MCTSTLRYVIGRRVCREIEQNNNKYSLIIILLLAQASFSYSSCSFSSLFLAFCEANTTHSGRKLKTHFFRSEFEADNADYAKQ